MFLTLPQDMNVVDTELPEYLSDFLWCLLEVLGILYIICSTVTAIILPIVMIIITNYLILVIGQTFFSLCAPYPSA